MSKLTATQARAALPEVLDRVTEGEEITITRHGRAVAVVVRPDALSARGAEAAFISAEQVRAAVEAGRRAPVRGAGRVSAVRAEELIAKVRAGRNRG